MSSLEGQVSVITAASRGIGRAIAYELARLGSALVINSLHQENCDNMKHELQRQGVEIEYVAGDIGDREVCAQLITKAVDAYGKIDVLVNNAGITIVNPALDFRDDDWDKTIKVNLNSAFYCSKLAATNMVRNGYGRIINIASVAGITPFPDRVAYCTTKAALIMMTRAMAIELAGRGVTVNCVAPGWVKTEGVKERMAKGFYSEESILLRSPIKRMGTPEEIARVVAFIASKDSSYMTGETVIVDGGWSSWGYL
ncbi:MAG: SDR family NAD(P)-dependent oxidoreductase [Conexivisphaerales archaeon]